MVAKIISAIVIITCVSIAGVVTLSVLGKPTADLIQFLGLLIGATVPSFFALAQLQRVHSDVKEVKDQVNGRMTELVNKIPDQESNNDR